MIWREKRNLLITLGILLAANTLFFFTYRVQYENRLEALQDRLTSAEGGLQAAHNSRVAAERRYGSYKKIQRDVQEIYTRRWATQDERLAPLISEVKRLTVASQLVPTSIAFTQSKEKLETTRGDSGATRVDLTFSVSGNYQQVRRLINALELSDQFVIIDSIAISAAGDASLTLNMKVKTLFRDPKAVVMNRQL
jgi:hypothetical protein